MTALTAQQQIDVMENIDWKDMKLNQLGLCYGIIVSSENLFGIVIPWYNISVYIPLLTRKNASKLGDLYEYTPYWWEFDEEGYQKRKEFVDWIIETLKTQISNEFNS